MHDPHFYPAPNTFDGLRYTRRTLVDSDDSTERENRMYGDSITEVKREFPVWGFGGHVWFVFFSPSLPLFFLYFTPIFGLFFWFSQCHFLLNTNLLKYCSPGRYHAALVMKMVVIYLVSEYEFQLEKPGKPWKWWWDNLAMPYEGTRVLVRKRTE